MELPSNPEVILDQALKVRFLLRLRRAIRNQELAVTSELYPLVFDPQTSGGLLASVPEDRAEACIAELIALGYPSSVVVGKVTEQSEHLEPVTLRV